MSVFNDSESVQETNRNSIKHKTFMQWQQLRRSRPSGKDGYYSTASQKQMLKDRVAMGDAFYG
ncbi:hypothetical protein N9K51_00925 [bacterium]|nr:hypothetical protein [bacterium]